MIDVQREISQSKSLYEELGNNQGIEEYNELNSQLKQKITRFLEISISLENMILII